MAPVRFRSTFNRALSIVSWSLCALAALAAVLTPGALPGLIGVPLGAAGAAALVWALLWAPFIEVDDDAVRVGNIFIEYVVPWAALIHVDTQFSLTLHTPGKRIRATAAPAPGQLTAFRATRAEKRRLGRLGAHNVRPGDLPGTDSGRAAELVRGRWETLRDSGRIEAGLADQTPVRLRARTASVAAAVLGAVAVLWAVLSV